MVLDADGRLAYTADPVASVVSVLDVATGDVAATVPVGSGPHALAASPDGTRVAVVGRDGEDVSLIDTATQTVVTTVPGVGASPQHVAYAPDGRHLYTADAGDGTVSAVDTATGSVTARVPTGPTPTGVAVLPDGSRVLVTHSDGTVRVLATA